jgi:hypothetical protein
LEDIGNDEIKEMVLSATILDQKEIMSALFTHWNSVPVLQAHAHNLLKSPDSKRNPKRNLKEIAGRISRQLRENGCITWKWAKEMYSLRDASQFAKIMKYVPNKIQSSAKHVDGGSNWYYHEDWDPVMWISPHDKGRIDIIQYPVDASDALLQMAINSNERSFSAHRILTKEKSKFKLPDKFTPLRYKEWADRHLTPLMATHGFNPNTNRRVYKKQ